MRVVDTLIFRIHGTGVSLIVIFHKYLELMVIHKINEPPNIMYFIYLNIINIVLRFLIVKENESMFSNI
jgi:hypothetical protein